jgi:hypothetical protein
MKEINEYLTGKNTGIIKDPLRKGYCNISNLSNNLEYVLIYPYGQIEFFTSEGLDDYINDMYKMIENGEDPHGEVEDSISTYEELKNIKEYGEWKGLSGPSNPSNKSLSNCIGIRYQAKK